MVSFCDLDARDNASSIWDGVVLAPLGGRGSEGWSMGEGWIEGWEDGATAICLCVLTHCPPQMPDAQISRSETPANCSRWVKCENLYREIRRSRGPTWQERCGKMLLIYHCKSCIRAAAEKSALSLWWSITLILLNSPLINYRGSQPTVSPLSINWHLTPVHESFFPKQQQQGNVKHWLETD